MLNHLSTRFCLQLCSSLLNHIDQRKSFLLILVYSLALFS
jgi:hypothetical protein